MPDFRFNFDFVPVSFIENILTETNGAYIRVYLYALSLAVKGESADNSEISKKLNLLESDVLNALSYREEKGLLTVTDDDLIVFGNALSDFEKKPDNKRKSANMIEKIIEQDKELAELCAVSQETLGRVLTKTEIETIYWFYDELGFSPEVIALLLEYCVSINKTNIGYIEKVAINWDKNGINTIEAAMRYLESESEKKSSSYELRKIFGINDRSLTKIEENYINTWTQKYGMEQNMIALAYEYCIMQTNKLSFPYMNSIIQNWHKKGIDNIEAAQKDREDFKAKNKKFEQKDTNVYSEGDYDSNTIERLMRNKYD